MIKLLALDMDGTLLNEAKEIPQAHITAIHQAIEKGVKLVLCTGRPLFGVLPYYKKLGLDLQNEYVIVNNGCSTHQTSDWGLVDWQELSPADIEYLYDLAEKSDVQLTLFDEEHYFVLGGKPNEIVQNDAKLVFSDLDLKFLLRKRLVASTVCSKVCFWGQKAKQTILRIVLLRSFANDSVEYARSLLFMKLCHLVRQRLLLFLD